MYKRRYLCAFGLASFLLLTLLAGLALADPSAQADPPGPAVVAIDPPELTVEPGATFTVAVTIAETEDLGGFEFRLDFDPSVVQAVDVARGEFIKSTGRTVIPAGPEIDNTEGVISMGAVSFGSADGPSGAGALAVITWEAVGEGLTTLHPYQVIVLDTDMVEQETVVRDGSVDVESGLTPTEVATATSTPSRTPDATATMTLLPTSTPTREPTAAATTAPTLTPTASEASTGTPSGEAGTPTLEPTATAVAVTPSPTDQVEKSPSPEEVSGPTETASATPGEGESEVSTPTETPAPTEAGSTTVPSSTPQDGATPTSVEGGSTSAPEGPPTALLVAVALVLAAAGIYLVFFLPRRLMSDGNGADEG